MAENNNGGWSVNNDRVIIDGDEQNTAPVNRDNLVLHRINENGTIGEMVDTINENFKSIAMHGGGPAGMDGINGFDGVDGTNVEYIYALSDEMVAGTHYPTDSGRLKELFEKCDMYHSHPFNNVTWYDHAQPISKEHKDEYVFSRFRRTNDESSPWYYADKPVLWAHWGETGKDGDGVEYIFRIYDHELTDDECRNAFSYMDSMDNEMKAIYNIDDFYPGATWFNATNKEKAESALRKAGLYRDNSSFDTRWTAKFNFCDNGSWTDDPTGTGYGKPYEYVAVRRSNTDEVTDKKEWSKYSEPALWSKYSFEGRIFIIYANLPIDQKPTADNGLAPKKGDGWWDVQNDKLIFTPSNGAGTIPSIWTDDNRDTPEGYLCWMCSGIFDHTGKNISWSNPTCISGKDGKPGEDGTTIEFIYALTDRPEYPTTVRNENDSNDPETKEGLFNLVEADEQHNPKYYEYHSTKWYDRAQPISPTDRTEYIWSRRREKETDPWEYDAVPIMWAHWGEDGTDGDGVEYIFTTTTEDIPDSQLDTHPELKLPKYSTLNDTQKKLFQIDDFIPSKQWFEKKKADNTTYLNKSKAEEALGRTISDTEWTGYFGFGDYPGWTDNPIKVNPMEPYQWVSIRRSNSDENGGKRFWKDFGTPSLWSSYGKSTRVFMVYCNMTSESTPKTPTGGYWYITNNVSKLVMSKDDTNDYKCNALQVGEPEDYVSYKNYWYDKNEDVDGTISWMSSGIFGDDGYLIGEWSKPFRMTGGRGEKGADGTNIEFVYCLSDSEPEYPKNGTTEQKNEFFHNVETADPVEWTENPTGYPYNGSTWFDNPQGIENEDGKRTEWVWQREKPANATETTPWTYAPTAVIWSHWGEDGTDGDGVEYIFFRSTNNPLESNQLPANKSELTTNIQKAIYNINDFYPGPGWFVETPVNHKEQAKQAIKDINAYTTDAAFEDAWSNHFGIRIVGEPDGPFWTDNPAGADMAYPFEWVSIRRSHPNSKGDREWDSFGTPTIWTKYNMKTRIFIVYCSVTEGTPVSKPTGGWWDGTDDGGLTTNKPGFELSEPWTDTDIDAPGKIAYLSSGVFGENGRNISWSVPFRMTGEKGKKGADGSNIEFVYCLSENMPDYPAYTGDRESYTATCNFFDRVENAKEDSDPEHDGYVYGRTEWFDNPQGITDEEGKRKEWVWSRSKSAGEETAEWTFPEKPVIWAHWGEDGTDGDGVEYIFSLGNSAEYPISSENWNSIWTHECFTTDTAKFAYAMDDFIPHVDWFDNQDNYTAVQTAMQESGKVISSQEWRELKEYIAGLNDFGTWTDNPSSVTPSSQYQYVSIRKMSDGEWQPFSYPKVWAKYTLSQYTAFAFAATPSYIDLTDCQPSGGTYATPVPDEQTYQGFDINWTDGPEPTAKYPQVWMTTAVVKESTPNDISWSEPKKMADSQTFQVEWSETDKSLSELITINSKLSHNIEGGYTYNSKTYQTYDFDEYLKNNNDVADVAEDVWRRAVEEKLGIRFSDNSTKAILMATCECKDNKWSHWTINRVKGEQGEAGSSLNVTGHITYERYLPSDATYKKSDVETFMGTPGGDPDQWPSNPKDNERLMVFPHEPNEYNIYAGDYTGELDGALYMWKYNATTHQWEDWNDENTNGEQIGNTYTCPTNGHLILWDGDSWQDVGNIKGPAGPINKILVRFADDDPQDSTKKVFVSEENIPSAKWVGFLTYTEGTEEFQPIENPDGVSTDGANNRWVWSLFKGQDGYGFEYIFKATSTNTPSSNIPNVPQQPANDNWRGRANVVPTSLGWSDEPIQPDETNKFVWMCWRKYDASEREWTDFMGNSANPGKARLWQVYARSIVTVTEYYHADASMSPSPVGGYDWFNCKDTTRSGWDSYWKSKNDALEDWDDTRRYLFNVEVITYSDDTPEVLDPHFIAIYASGLYDIKEFYCLDTDGETVPNVTGGKVILDNDVHHLPSSKVAQVSAGLISSENEGKLYWTTNAKKTKISAANPFLWNISYMMYDDSSKDGWSDPYVIGVYGKGDNGTDSIYVDLDNEMDAIQIKDNKDSNKGTVVNNGTYTAILRLYKGSTLLKIRECDVANEDKFDELNNRQSFKLEITDSINVETPTWTIYNQQSIENGFEALKMTIDLRADDVITNPYNSKIQFTVTSVDGDVRMASYTAVFTTNPTVYSIVLSDTELVEKTVTQNNQNVTVIDPDPLSLYVRAQSGLTVLDPIRKNVSGKYQLDVYLNGSMITSLLSNPYRITSSDYTTLSLKADDRLTFAFNAYINGTAYEMDRETVFVLKEGKDGQPGAAGNGYQYYYGRTSKNETYNGTTLSIVNSGSDIPTINYGGVNLANMSYEPNGVDADHIYEFRTERSGYGPSNWGNWTKPVTIAKFLTIDGMEEDVEQIINGIIDDTNTTLGSALDRLDTLSSAFTSDGTFNGTISSGVKSTLLAGVVTSDTFTNELKKVSLAGLSIDGDPDAPSIKTFADWVDYENNKLKTASTNLEASLGQLTNKVAQLEGNDATAAIDRLKVDVHDKFASTERTIANSNYLTDASTGALLVNIPDYVTWFKTEGDMSSNKSGVEIDEKRSIEWVLCNDITNSNYTYAPFSTNLSTLYDNVTKKKPIVLQLNNISYSNISSGFINTLTNNLRNNLTIAVSLSSDDTPISYSIESNETGYGITSKAADTGLSTTITTGVSASKVKCILYTDVTLDYSAINSKDENNKVVFSNLNWKAGIVKKSSNVSDTNITFAYTKTASIDDVPWFNTSMVTDSSKYQDIFDNLTMNSIYGYTLKKSGNSVIPAETYGTLGITSPDGYDFKLLPADGVTVSDVVDYLKNNNTSVISTDSWISADNSIPYNTTSKEYYVACSYSSGTPDGQVTYAVELSDSGNSSYLNTVSFVSTDISNIVDDSVSVSISQTYSGAMTTNNLFVFGNNTYTPINNSTVTFSIPSAGNVSAQRDILEGITIATDYINSQVNLTFTNISNSNNETIYYLILPSKYTSATYTSISGSLSTYLTSISTYPYNRPEASSYFDMTKEDNVNHHFLDTSSFGTNDIPYKGTNQIWRNTTDNPSTIVNFNKAYESGNMYYFTILIRRHAVAGTTLSNSITVNMTTEPANTMTWITSGKNRIIQFPFKSYLLDKIKVTIKDRSVSDTFENSNRIATGSPTSYLSVLPSERPYLISSVTELATISQHISEGIASTEIIAKAGDSTAVFFEQAIDGGGSQIYMNANEIGIESDYFKLDNNGLSMKGNLYAQDEYGHITAGIIGENKTDSNDIKFFAGTSSNTESILFNDINSAPFRVYEDGHVVANDIEINAENGNTKLGDEGLQTSLHKTSSINVDEESTNNGYKFDNGTYTGDVTIHTDINSYGLSVYTEGSVTNGTDTIDISENKLYIKYFDRIPNPDAGIQEKPLYGKQYLYGVPVLCMYYMGEEYILSPGSWYSSNSNSSSIRWVKSKDVYIYSFAYYSNNSTWFYSSRTSGITLSSLISTAGHYYVFKDSNAHSAGVGGRTDKELYQIKVDLGNDSSNISNYKTWIITDNSLAPTTTLTDKSPLQTWINSNGVRALKERIDEAYRGIASNSKTPITEDICSTYKGYVQSSVILADNEEFYIYSYTDKIIQNLYDKFKYFVGAAGDRFNSGPSSTNINHWIYSSYHPYDCAIQWLYNALPFDDGVSTVTRTISLNCKYYPQYTLTNGLTESNINTVFCVCTFYMYGYYSNHPTFNYYTTLNNFNGTAQMNTFLSTLSFDFILTFDSAITKSSVEGKIKSFLEKFDFTKLQSNHVDISAEIIANGDYNNMHFTKSTFDPITT